MRNKQLSNSLNPESEEVNAQSEMIVLLGVKDLLHKVKSGVLTPFEVTRRYNINNEIRIVEFLLYKEEDGTTNALYSWIKNESGEVIDAYDISNWKKMHGHNGFRSVL